MIYSHPRRAPSNVACVCRLLEMGSQLFFAGQSFVFQKLQNGHGLANLSIMTHITLRGGVEGVLAKSSRGTTTSTANWESRIIRTSGEIFADGSMLELVSSATDNQLGLLFWHKHRKTIARQIEYRDRFYQAPDLDESLLRAIRPTQTIPKRS